MPAANGGTNCTGDDTETNGIIMLTGGTTWDGATVPVLEPTFVSINPNYEDKSFMCVYRQNNFFIAVDFCPYFQINYLININLFQEAQIYIL